MEPRNREGDTVSSTASSSFWRASRGPLSCASSGKKMDCLPRMAMAVFKLDGCWSGFCCCLGVGASGRLAVLASSSAMAARQLAVMTTNRIANTIRRRDMSFRQSIAAKGSPRIRFYSMKCASASPGQLWPAHRCSLDAGKFRFGVTILWRCADFAPAAGRGFRLPPPVTTAIERCIGTLP
jgi:hypothetical protein